MEERKQQERERERNKEKVKKGGGQKGLVKRNKVKHRRITTEMALFRGKTGFFN